MSLVKYMMSLFFAITLLNGIAQTQRINFVAPLAYPEGTAWYQAGNCFFVSSVTTATIGKVDINGNYTVFHEEPALKSSYGMKVDAARNKLWVCTGDANYSFYRDSATYKKMIKVISLNLSTGEKIDEIDLSNLIPGKHFANDLTLDGSGNIYVTDSYSPVVYKINTQLQASVFCQNTLFNSIDVGLNGIVWHSGNAGGFLLVAHNTNGAIYKIRLNNPSVVEIVETNSFFPGADGLNLDNAGNLALVQNKGTNKVFQLRSSNNWNTARVVAGTLLVDRFDNPTTLARKGNELFALNAKLNELMDPTEPPSKEFSLQKVRFVLIQ